MSIFCSACGVLIAENTPHSCKPGVSVLSSAGGVSVAHPATANIAPTPLAPNVAGALAYAAGFVTGIAFLLLEPYKHDRYVRFHAWQSIIFSLSWIAFWIPWSIFTSMLISGMAMTSSTLSVGGGLPFIALFITALNRLLSFAAFAICLFLLYKAYGGREFTLPVLGKFAAKHAGHA
jgi:uncharacterized membrane protein